VINKIDEQGLSLSEASRHVLGQYQNSGEAELRSFLRISQVDEDSPSHRAGFQRNDEILQFGPFTAGNTKRNLGEIGEHVKERENRIILVKARRQVEGKSEILRFKLIPEAWSGHGLLGCRLNFI
jgi:hypothetical protein